MPGAIVLGFDGTDGSWAALDEALSLAKLKSVPVHAVFVYDKVVVGGESRDLDEKVENFGIEVLAKAADKAKRAGVPFESELVEGRAAQSIADAADREHASYIVVGSFGERPIHALLVGAVPNKLMYLSDRPIVVVRAPEDS